ncbi:TetR/AcrR family transcriptional regulator [Streptomyces sp. HUAS MG47]|uniref:TetR/AcrR family transcriptional regulator n=1 Tax=Streptomyces solicamelliae TaxID=3231716 RepID=UPI0038779038
MTPQAASTTRAVSTDAATAAARRSKITPERETELFEAVLDLLREGGYDAVTMEGVAARTKCGKATLYRQWKNKPQLVTAALTKNRCPYFAGVDTGTLIGDLREVARLASCRRDRDAELMEAVSQAYVRHPDLREALYETVIQPEVAAVDAMLARGVERGELAPDNPATAFVAPCLMGMLRVERVLEERFADTPETMTAFIESVILPALDLDEQ